MTMQELVEEWFDKLAAMPKDGEAGGVDVSNIPTGAVYSSSDNIIDLARGVARALRVRKSLARGKRIQHRKA